MHRAVLGLMLVAAFSFGVLSTYAVMQHAYKLHNTAAVKVVGVGVYKDVSFTVNVEKIDWGVLEPGESRNVTVYIRNESNVPVSLSMIVGDWNPAEAEAYISLCWNYDGSQIPVDGWLPVTFALHVSPETSGLESFSFTITIVGVGE